MGRPRPEQKKSGQQYCLKQSRSVYTQEKWGEQPPFSAGGEGTTVHGPMEFHCWDIIGVAALVRGWQTMAQRWLPTMAQR